MALDSLDNLEQSGLDKDVRDFLMIEQQKALLQAQIHQLNDLCWEKCFTDKPGNKLDSRTETCMSNCVDRFVDTSMAVATRFASIFQKAHSQ